MSSTTQAIGSTTITASATATTADTRRGIDATRFLIIAACICAFLGVTMGTCYMILRIRKARMRRLVIAAFEQGLFDFETVQQRMAFIHRNDPNMTFKPSSSASPEYFDKLGKPTGMANTNTNVGQLNLQCPHYFLPLSAHIQANTPTVEDVHPGPHLSLLPLEKQLALLFDASRAREEKRRRKAERKHVSAPLTTARKPGLVLSVMITMPRVQSGGGDGDLVFGTTVFPWDYQVAEPASHMMATTTEDANL